MDKEMGGSHDRCPSRPEAVSHLAGIRDELGDLLHERLVAAVIEAVAVCGHSRGAAGKGVLEVFLPCRNICVGGALSAGISPETPKTVVPI